MFSKKEDIRLLSENDVKIFSDNKNRLREVCRIKLCTLRMRECCLIGNKIENFILGNNFYIKKFKA